MTVIAAVKIGDDVAMAADSMTCDGEDGILQGTASKIHRIGDTLLGRAGYAVYGNILDDILSDREGYIQRKDIPEPCGESGAFRFMMWLAGILKDRYRLISERVDGDEYPFINLRAHFIFASREGIYDAGPGIAVHDCGKFHAIGAGAHYALGSIYSCPHISKAGSTVATFVAKTAVEAACDLNVYCRPPIQVVTLDEKADEGMELDTDSGMDACTCGHLRAQHTDGDGACKGVRFPCKCESFVSFKDVPEA